MGPRFVGRQYKGAMRSHRENLRAEAQFRQKGFETDVRRVMREQNVEEPTARIVAAKSRRFDRRMGSEGRLMTALVLPALPDGVDIYVGTTPAPSHLFLERRPAGSGTGTEYDPSGWPTWDQIKADAEWDEIVRHLQDASDTARAVRDEYARALADVAEAVEQAAVPVTGAIPVSVPLTKTDAHEGTVKAVITHVCVRLREIARTRRTSELPRVIATLEAVV